MDQIPSNSSQEDRRDDLSSQVVSYVGKDLDPYRDALKRDLDRVHMMMTQMMTVRGHQSLLMDNISGRVRLSKTMERTILVHLNRMLARSRNLVKGRKKRRKKKSKRRTPRKSEEG